MTAKQTWTSDNVAACTCANLRRATRAITQLYDGMLQPAGITSTQFTLLAALDYLGKTPIGELADRLGMDRTSLSRTVRPLQEAEYVRIGSATDRRVRLLTLTAAGQRKLADALPLWKSAQRRVVRHMGDTGWSNLLSHLSAAATA